MSIQELLSKISDTRSTVLLTPSKEMPLMLSQRYQKTCHRPVVKLKKKPKIVEIIQTEPIQKREEIPSQTQVTELDYSPFKLQPNSSFNPSKLSKHAKLSKATLAKYEAYSVPAPDVLSKVLQSENRAKSFLAEERSKSKIKDLQFKKKWDIIHSGITNDQIGTINAQKARDRMRAKIQQIVSHKNSELKCLIEGQSSALEAIRLKEFLVPPRKLKLDKLFTEKDRVRLEELISDPVIARGINSYRFVKRCLSSYVEADRKKVSVTTIKKLYCIFYTLRIVRKEPITVMTAHDYPSATFVEKAGIEVCLVGDSLAQVALGYDNTNRITLDEMMHHSRAVARGIKSCFIVGDLPFGSYETSSAQAVNSSVRYLKEGAVHAVKLEGGAEMSQTIHQITKIGIPVLGHIGLTPQRAFSLGGFTVQGKTLEKAQRLYSDAIALQEAGCFAIVLEAIPEEVATFITSKLSIPTIGIGAGPATSGQVLVQMDVLKSNFSTIPKFCQPFADIGELSVEGLQKYRQAVKSKAFPSSEHHTYPMSPMEKEKLLEWIQELDRKNTSMI